METIVEYNTYRDALAGVTESIDEWMDAPAQDCAAQLTRLSDAIGAAKMLIEAREKAKEIKIKKDLSFDVF